MIFSLTNNNLKSILALWLEGLQSTNWLIKRDPEGGADDTCSAGKVGHGI